MFLNQLRSRLDLRSQVVVIMRTDAVAAYYTSTIDEETCKLFLAQTLAAEHALAVV